MLALRSQSLNVGWALCPMLKRTANFLMDDTCDGITQG
jgi:hypothetical protein